MKFLVITNHSYMLWQFRREVIAELQKRGEVVLSMPFVGHEDDFAAMGCKCMQTDVDRRGINPVTDFKLYQTYKACRKMGIPYCVNVQGLGTAFQKEPIAAAVTLMYRVALKKAKTVFFENKGNAAEFVRRGIVPAEQETVLSGAGVNLDVYRQQPYPPEEDGIHFLFLGRIMREKGVDELFEAAKGLKKKYGEKVVFDLVGFFEDEYKETVERLAADGVVKFHGFQSDPKPFYGGCHCVVLPSYHEGMSNVLLEAAATGRAVITTDIHGCKEAVDDGESGFLCKKKDSADLENCLERFIHLDTAARERMGLQGRRKMEAEFDKKTVVNETIAAMMGDPVSV